MSGDTVVIGAGIVGTYCALHLSRVRDPTKIIIVDREPFAYRNASCVNMGGFATCEVQPLASPRNVLRAIKWLWNPRAPLAIRFRYLPQLRPWMRVFLQSAFSHRQFQHVVATQQTLMKSAGESHLSSLEGTGLDDLINRNGAIGLYKSRRGFERDWNGRWRLFREQGSHCRRLPVDELRALLPDLSPDVQYAIHVPEIHFWEEPRDLLSGLHKTLQERGVRIVAGTAVGFCRSSRAISAIELAGGEELQCREIVVATGAFSKPLCRDLGDEVPLDTERGYSTSLPSAGVRIRHLLLLVEDDFVATPMRSGLRLGGTVELAGLKAPPDFRRTELLAEQIRNYFPNIDTRDRHDMLGFRPSVADGLPVISRSTKFANTWYAFGHGHVGMTQSAITGKLIAQAMDARKPDIDLAPFTVRRFG